MMASVQSVLQSVQSVLLFESLIFSTSDMEIEKMNEMKTFILISYMIYVRTGSIQT